MFKRFLKFFITLAVFATVFMAYGAAYSLPPSAPSDAAYVTDGAVNALDTDADGNIYIGGSFAYVGPNTGSFVPLDSTTGSPTGTYPKVWGTGADSGVFTSVPDGSGGWYIGGQFSSVGTEARNNIAHINADGTVDATFNPNANGDVNALILSGTKLYVGGTFTSIGGASRSKIAELNATTGIATNWNPNAGNTVWSLAISANAVTPSIYVGGAFTTIGGQTRNKIAEIKLSDGTATSWDPNLDNLVYTIVVGSGVVYIGGSFERTAGGTTTRNRIAAIDTNTGIATAWNPNATNNDVRSMLLSGSSLYVGGGFQSIGGQQRFNIARLNVSDGLADAWYPTNGTGNNETIYSFALNGTTLYVGGPFNSLGGKTRSGIAAVNTGSGVVLDWDPNAHQDRIVKTVSVDPVDPTHIYAGGTFQSIGRVARKNVAKLDKNGRVDLNWNPAVVDSNEVKALKVVGTGADTKVYIGGGFSGVGGNTKRYLVGLNSTGAYDWAPSVPPPDIYPVLSMDVSDGVVYTGGYGYLKATTIATGADVWLLTSGVGANKINNNVNALKVSGTNLYLGGSFTSVHNVTRNRAAAVSTVDGSLLDWNPNVSTSDSYVYAIDIVKAEPPEDSVVYIGGTFTTVGGQARNRIAAVNFTDGSYLTWNPNASSDVKSIYVSDNVVYVGGSFGTIAGGTRNRAAAIGAVGAADAGTLLDWNPNINQVVNAIKVVGSSAYVGGTLTAVGGTAASNTRYYFAYFKPPNNPPSVSFGPFAKNSDTADNADNDKAIEGETVTLIGSCNDGDYPSTVTAWFSYKEGLGAGESVSIVGDTAADPEGDGSNEESIGSTASAEATIIIPNIAANRSIVMTLNCSDGEITTPADFTVYADAAPTVDAGTVNDGVGEATTLDLGAVSDFVSVIPTVANTEGVTYLWTELSDCHLVISDTAVLLPTIEIPESLAPCNISLQLTADDHLNPAVTDTVSFSTAADNDAPVITEKSLTDANEKAVYAGDTIVATDSDSLALTYTIFAGALPAGFSMDSSTGAISGTAANLIRDTLYSFTVRVTDGERENPPTRSFTMWVRAVNDSPVFSTEAGSIGTVEETQLFTGSVSATDPDPDPDPDPDLAPDARIFAYSIVEPTPAGLSINSSNGNISYTSANLPKNAEVSFTVQVTDGVNPVTRNFSIAVSANNDAPIFSAEGALAAASENEEYSAMVLATDPEGLAVTYGLAEGNIIPSGLTLNEETGEISGTPAEAIADETYDFEITATDADGITSVGSFSITVSAANEQISGLSAGEDKTATSGGSVSVTGIAATDPEGEPIIYTWSINSNNCGAAPILSSTSELAITVQMPATTDECSVVLKLSANDGVNTDISDLMTISIGIPVSGMTAAIGPDRTMIAGSRLQLSGRATGGQGSYTYEWRVTSGQAEIVDPTSEYPLIYVAPEAEMGDLVVELYAADETGRSATDDMVIHVLGEASGKILDGPLTGGTRDIRLYEDTQESGSENSKVVRVGTGETRVFLPEGITNYSMALTSDGRLVIGLPEISNNIGAIYISNSSIANLTGEFTIEDNVSLDLSAFAVSKQAISDSSFTRRNGPSAGARFGEYLTVADVNGDGSEEIVTSATGTGYQGTIFVYGYDFNLVGTIDGSASNPVGALLGGAIMGEASSFADVLIGSRNTLMNKNLHFGPLPQVSTSNISGIVIGEESLDSNAGRNSYLGIGGTYYSSAIGDINGDGAMDVALAGTDSKIYVFFGPLTDGGLLEQDSAELTVDGSQIGGQFGLMVAMGDVSGDAIDDLVIGAPDYGADDAGAVFVVFGSGDIRDVISIEANVADASIVGAKALQMALDLESNTASIIGESSGDTIGGDLLVADYDGDGVMEIYTVKALYQTYMINLFAPDSRFSGERVNGDGAYSLRGGGGCGFRMYSGGGGADDYAMAIVEALLLLSIAVAGRLIVARRRSR